MSFQIVYISIRVFASEGERNYEVDEFHDDVNGHGILGGNWKGKKLDRNGIRTRKVDDIRRSALFAFALRTESHTERMLAAFSNEKTPGLSLFYLYCFPIT